MLSPDEVQHLRTFMINNELIKPIITMGILKKWPLLLRLDQLPALLKCVSVNLIISMAILMMLI